MFSGPGTRYSSSALEEQSDDINFVKFPTQLYNYPNISKLDQNQTTRPTETETANLFQPTGPSSQALPKITSINSIDQFNQIANLNRQIIQELPPYCIFEAERFICPLYPLCCHNFSDSRTLLTHIRNSHNHTIPFPLYNLQDVLISEEKLTTLFENLLPNMMYQINEYNENWDEVKFDTPFNCGFGECKFESKSTSELFTHMSEHARQEDNIGKKLSSGSFFQCYIFLLHKLGRFATLRAISEEMKTDTVIFLKRGMHYDDKNEPENKNGLRTDGNENKSPPWVGITTDNDLFDKTPILFEDGGILAARGQVKIEDGEIRISNQKEEIEGYNGAIELYNTDALLPEVKGPLPKYGPLRISDLTMDNTKKNEFLKMLLRMMINLGSNLNIKCNIESLNMMFQSQTIYQVPQIVTQNYDINIPNINVKIKEYDIEMPKMIIKDVDWPVPLLNPVKRILDYEIPVLNPTPMNIPLQYPSFDPIPTTLQVTYPNFDVTPTEVQINVPNFVNNQIETPIEVPKFNVKTKETNINYPTFSTTPEDTKISYPNFNSTPYETPISYPTFTAKPQETEILYPNFYYRPCEAPINYPSFTAKPKEEEIQYPNFCYKPCDAPINYPTFTAKPQETNIKYPNFNFVSNEILFKYPSLTPNPIVTPFNIPQILPNIIPIELKVPKFEFKIEPIEIPIKITNQIPNMKKRNSKDEESQNHNVRKEHVSNITITGSSSSSSSSDRDLSEDEHENRSDTDDERTTQESAQSDNTSPSPPTPSSSSSSSASSSSSSSEDEGGNNVDILRPIDILRELRAAQNLDDINNLINRWKGKLINREQWTENPDELYNPIINNIVINQRWPAPNKFICYKCLKYGANTYKKVEEHLRKEHEVEWKEGWINDLISSIIGKDIRYVYKKRNGNIVENVTIHRCTEIDCNKFTGTRNGFHSHLDMHKELKDRIKKMGTFWGSLCHWADENRFWKASDYFKKLKGELCPKCESFITNMNNGYKAHLNVHKEIRREGVRKPKSIDIVVVPVDGNAGDEFGGLISNDSEESDNPGESEVDNRQITENEDEDDNLDEIRNVNEDEMRTVNSQDSINENENKSNSESEDETEFDEDQRLRKAINWINKCKEEEELNISFPRLNLNMRRKLQEPLEHLFKTKIKELTKWIKGENEREEEWTITEGVLCKVNMLIRKKMREILKIPKDRSLRMRRKQNNRKVYSEDVRNRFTEKVHKIFNAQELVDMLETLVIMNEKRDRARIRNAIANLEQNIMNTIKILPDEIMRRLFPNKTLENIRSFIEENRERQEEKLKWLKTFIDREIGECEKMKSKNYKGMIRSMYREDPRRCVQWFISSEINPENNIDSNVFAEHFEKQWNQKNNINLNDEILRYERLFDEENQELFKKLLYDDKMIMEAICNKSNMSASGRDGLSYAIWKISPKETIHFIKKLLRSALQHRKMPEIWKTSKTVMLYKRGDPRNVGAWRPIALTASLYRVIMSHIAKCFQIMNNEKQFISKDQKGFKFSINGTAEHVATVNELISNATRNNQEIQLVTIDFADAFGSVSHKLIHKALLSIGFPEDFCGMIKDLYSNNTTNFSVKGQLSKEVHIEKGVRQGCPLSPLLFNICLDPLLRLIRKENEENGYFVDEKSYCIQAFADDVILISNSIEGMKKMLKTCEKFCKVTGMNITAEKCHWLSYMLVNRRRVSTKEKLNINGTDLIAENIDEAMLYLGAPIATNRYVKMRETDHLISEIKVEIQKLFNSQLALSQCIDALKRLICPKLDYLLLNGLCPIKKIEELDRFIRGKICKSLGGKGIPKDYFYTHWKDGGLSIPEFKERSQVLQIKTCLNMILSRDEDVRNVVKRNMLEECKKRNLLENEEAIEGFLNYQDVKDERTHKTDTLFTRALHGTGRLNISIKLEENDDDKEEMSIVIFDKLKEDMKENVDPRNFLKVMNKLFRKRHYESLRNLTFKGHTFFDSESSAVSNDYFGVNSPIIPDCIIKFMINARCNNLPTNELLAKNKDGHISRCEACNSNENDSLMHRLNGCKASLNKFTERHNNLCKIINDSIRRKYGRNAPPIHENSTVRWLNKEELSIENSVLKPDIWYGIENEDGELDIKLIEVNCPYGGYHSQNGERVSKLSERRQTKINKYQPLVEEIRRKWNAKVSLHVIIISSLGVIPNDTLKDLNSLFHNKKTLKNIARRLSTAATIGSYNIFYNKNMSPFIYAKTDGIRKEETNDSNSDSKDELNDDVSAQESDVIFISQDSGRLVNSPIVVDSSDLSEESH